MTREEILQGAEIMKAYVEGKQLQYKYYTFDAWTDCDNPQFNFELFQYRIKPKEPTYRPYKDCEEMIADFNKRFPSGQPNCSMPLIWLRDKDGDRLLVHGFLTIAVELSEYIFTTLVELRNKFTYLDGSPCGKKEEE